MSKKIINVKYHQGAIAGIDAKDLEKITTEIKELIGDDYTVIFTPFDFQEIPPEGLFETIEEVLNSLKVDGRDKDIIKIAEIVSRFVPAEAQADGEHGCNDSEPKYHQCDSDESYEESCKVIDCDA